VTPFLEARGVGRRFHAGTPEEVRALEGVDLAVERGAFLLVTGPSGSGKTTLLALLGTLERPTSGSILVEGLDPATLPEAARSRLRRRFGFAFPGGPMLPRLPLWENVTYGLLPLGHGVAARRAAAREALDRVGLGGKSRAAAEELSTGELHRAALARALAGRPEAILADEPLASLDPAAAGLVVEALAAFHRGGGTVVAATHATAPFPFATGTLRLEGGRRAGNPGDRP
jgi:putative ABC transport system ATP-binding protein